MIELDWIRCVDDVPNREIGLDNRVWKRIELSQESLWISKRLLREAEILMKPDVRYMVRSNWKCCEYSVLLRPNSSNEE